MTLEEIKRSDKPFLMASDVAPVLGCDPNFVRLAAHDKPELLGFPVTILGRRVKIPRKPFLRYLGEETE